MLPLHFQLPQNLPPAVHAVQRQTSEKNGLKVAYDEHRVDFQTKRQVFRGQVKAEFQQTTLTASELEIDEVKREGWARGQVKVLDPEGTLEADTLYFRWRRYGDPLPGPDEVTGRAENVRLRAGNVLMTGRIFEVRGAQWIITDGTGSLTQRKNPEWKFRARRVVLTPGSRGFAEHIYLEALGMKLGPLARYSFTLNPRMDSKFILPTYTKDQETGNFGLAWNFVRPLNENSVVKGSWSSFPRQPTSWNLTYAFSPLATEKTRAGIAPPSDLSERFEDGWMDNIQVISPAKEAEDMRQPRMSYQVQTDWNSGASGRRSSPSTIVRAADLSMEQGKQEGPFGLRWSARLQAVRSLPNEQFRARTLVQGAVQGPRWPLGHGLSAVTRLDSLATVSDRTAYGWMRGQAALVFEPSRQLRVGAAYVAGVDYGNPDFAFDRLFRDQALHLRADIFAGPLTARYLWKYDFERGLIYDREYEFAYVAGAFEPFIQYRQFPGSYSFGIRFRMDNVVNRLVSRQQRRTSR
jgi:hypothetical protein